MYYDGGSDKSDKKNIYWNIVQSVKELMPVHLKKKLAKTRHLNMHS